mgnify:CR=1 FL=1
MTSNHDYNTPAEGTVDWDVPLNENFRQIDTDAEIRDLDENIGQYSPKDGSKFLAVDTGTRYLGDGSEWVEAPSQDVTEAIAPTVSGDPSDARDGAVWYREDTDELRVQVNGRPRTIAGGSDAGTGELLWRLTFEDPESESLKDFSNRNGDQLVGELMDTWDYSNGNAPRYGMYYTNTDVSGPGAWHESGKEGDHAFAFRFANDEHFGCDLRKDIGLEEAWAQYWLKFPDGFDIYDRDFTDHQWAQSGKLPGWQGQENGDAVPDGRNGWKAWLIWKDPARHGYAGFDETGGPNGGDILLNYYVNHAKQNEEGPESHNFNRNGIVQVGDWHEITLHAKMNDIGSSNGVLEAWVDGEQAFDKRNWEFRREGGEHLDVHQWAQIGYFGGNWQSSKDQAYFVDDVRIYRTSPL